MNHTFHPCANHWPNCIVEIDRHGDVVWHQSALDAAVRVWMREGGYCGLSKVGDESLKYWLDFYGHNIRIRKLHREFLTRLDVV